MRIVMVVNVGRLRVRDGDCGLSSCVSLRLVSSRFEGGGATNVMHCWCVGMDGLAGGHG